MTDQEVRAAIERGKSIAEEWNLCDPETSIPAEAAKQIVLAALGTMAVSDLVITSALQKLDDPMQAPNWLLWRTGRKVGRTLYAMPLGIPSDDDPLIGLMDSDALASEVVNAHNAVLRPVQFPKREEVRDGASG